MLHDIPDNWLLIRLDGKRPLGGKRWYNHGRTISEIENPKNLGLLCGPENQIVAIDCDGYPEWIDERDFPETFGVTSGKDGHYCLFYTMPKGDFKHTTIKGKFGKVEIRYNRKQQVIWGVHPDTKEPYKWVGNPQEIAPAPQWLLELMTPSGELVEEIDGDFSEIAYCVDLLKKIKPTDDYEDWLKVGMALKTVSEGLFDDWVNWSLKADNTCSMEVYRNKWDSFSNDKNSKVGIGTLHFLVYGPGEKDAKKQILDRYVFMPGDNKFWDKYVRKMIPKEGLNGAYVRLSQGKKKFKAADLVQYQGLIGDQLVYLPGHPEFLENVELGEENELKPGKSNLVNLGASFPRKTDADPLKALPWVNHIKFLYPEEADHIFNWLACTVQHPAQKINHALVFHGAQGIGKSGVFSILGAALGSHYGMTQLENVIEGFNDELEARKLLILDEPESAISGRGKLANTRLKNLIAAPPFKLQINRKYQLPYNTPNIVNICITTNDINGLKIENADRRYFVCTTNATPKAAEYYRQLFSVPSKAVFAWLMKHDLTGFDPTAIPPRSKGTEQMVQATKSEIETLCEDAYEEMGKPDHFWADDFKAKVNEFVADEFRTIDPRLITKQLLKAGFVRSEKRKERKDGSKAYAFRGPSTKKFGKLER